MDDLNNAVGSNGDLDIGPLDNVPPYIPLREAVFRLRRFISWRSVWVQLVWEGCRTDDLLRTRRARVKGETGIGNSLGEQEEVQ
jgi:hypothetical protein